MDAIFPCKGTERTAHANGLPIHKKDGGIIIFQQTSFFLSLKKKGILQNYYTKPLAKCLNTFPIITSKKKDYRTNDIRENKKEIFDIIAGFE